MTKTDKTTIWNAIRQLLYCVGCIGITFLEHAIAALYKEKTFDENGIMENIQLGELLIACALFLFISFRREAFHRMGIIFAALSATAACRELDNFFDNLIPVIGWKFALFFIAAAFCHAMANWKKTREELLAFWRHPAFPMMCCAITVIIPIGQCIGHKSFVINVLQMEHVSSIKEFVEESIETAGYFILICSAIELFWPRKTSTDLPV